ncbi:MAG: 4Fe-4S binding protein [Candidatus Omnitrophica bacterium]|nr:4Fe-4S binding protein [Candidatus Omnitrophota bacterium]
MRLFLFFLILSVSSGLFCQEEDNRIIFPNSDRVIESESPFKYSSFYRRKEFLGFSFKASDIISERKGFSGDIDVLIGINAKARINEVKVLEHSETPGYGDKICDRSFLGQFKDKSIYDNFIVGDDIDGITQASISSKSLARIVRESSRLAWEKLGYGRIAARGSGFNFSEILSILFIGLGLFLGAKKINFLRYFWLLLTIIYLGFYKGLYLGVFNFIQVCQLKFPSFYESPGWYVLFAASIIAGIFFGRFYCGWLCPFGAAQEVVSKIPLKKIRVSFNLNRRLLKAKYYFLALGVLLFSAFNNSFIFHLEPFSYFFSLNLTLLFIYSFFLVLASLFIPRFYCRYFCLAGSIFGIISRVSLVKYKLSFGKENRKFCIDRCPTGVIGKTIIDNECLRCNLCQKCSLKIKDEKSKITN